MKKRLYISIKPGFRRIGICLLCFALTVVHGCKDKSNPEPGGTTGSLKVVIVLRTEAYITGIIMQLL